MRLLKAWTASLLLLSPLFGAYGDFVTGRCPEKGGQNLDATQAGNRWEWVKKCDPQGYRSSVKSKFGLHDGVKRMTYPIYGVYTNLDAAEYKITSWSAPTDPKAPCGIPKDHEIVAFCFAGCYTLDQKVTFNVLANDFDFQDLNFFDAQNLESPRVVTLVNTEEPTDLLFTLYPTDIIPSLVEEEHTILSFQMASGNTLKVTTTHPLVNGDGYMKAAIDFQAGDSLVTASGQPDLITSIETTDYFGKVWNVDVKVESPFAKIVIGQGYLNGDISFQNENAKLLNQILLRSKIPDSLL